MQALESVSMPSPTVVELSKRASASQSGALIAAGQVASGSGVPSVMSSSAGKANKQPQVRFCKECMCVIVHSSRVEPRDVCASSSAEFGCLWSGSAFAVSVVRVFDMCKRVSGDFCLRRVFCYRLKRGV